MNIPVCRVCGEAKSLEEMVMRSPVHCDSLCKACKRAASQRAAAKTQGAARPAEPSKPGPVGMKLDPCPICHVTQAKHWKCRQCGSRGHQMGRGTLLPHLCGWCEGEALKAEMKEAA